MIASRIPAPWQGDAHRQQPVGLEAGTDVLQPPEAANQQPRADKQRHRECDFGHDQGAAQPLAARASARAGGAFLQRLDQIGLRRLQRGHETKDEPGEERRHHSEYQNASVNRQLVEPWQRVGRVGHDQLRRQKRDPGTDDSRDDRKEQRFDEQLRHDPRSLRAKRRANRNLALALCAACEQQVGHVAAGDDSTTSTAPVKMINAWRVSSGTSQS